MTRLSKPILAVLLMIGSLSVGIVAGQADDKLAQAGKNEAALNDALFNARLEKLTAILEKLKNDQEKMRAELRILHKTDPVLFLLPSASRTSHLEKDVDQIGTARNRLLLRHGEIAAEMKTLEGAGEQADARALRLLVKRLRGGNSASAFEDLKAVEPKTFLKIYQESLIWERRQIEDQLKGLQQLYDAKQAAVVQAADLLLQEKDIASHYESTTMLYQPLRELLQRLSLERNGK